MKSSDVNVFSRRRFLATSGGFIASTMALRGQDVVGANEQIRVGFIGLGGRGNSLLGQFLFQTKKGYIKNAKLVAVCDPDTEHMEKAAARAGTKPAMIRDYRKLLERKDIDAVFIASPNHWHALHTIHACQAGKDVYVEKPVSHTVWESNQMLAAVEKYGQIVQAGTQNRSDSGLIDAFKYLKEGNLGAIQSVHGLCIKNRNSIGKLDQPLVPPASLDYNLWLGPSQDKPIYRPQLHYDWHWDYNTGNGDIGNQGPHEFDLISWLLGDPEMPTEVFSYGGRFGWDDAGETANMQFATYQLNGVPCYFEVNDMSLKPDANVPANYKGIRIGIVVNCEGGEFRGGRGGGYVLGPDGKTKIAKFPGDAGRWHMLNFFDAVRSRRTQDLRAPLINSCKSAAIPHFANISLRTGEQVPLAKLPSVLPQTAEFADVIERQSKQLKNWNIDFEKTLCTVGSNVILNPATGDVSGPANAAAFNRPQFRKGFEVPELANNAFLKSKL
ncbi:dehydrogenase [Coraliomargarita sinensis]|uniref:Dehydrogenase n=1 Tax=Coraliomargarita sinensis TaxID=2174842 RepID=A0A317ZM08_9BACT|nr:Gfo/Idh/MocA family oxidoreductase [Coraliomargarita sinensis]PXA04421.1 dehydrogenase [Coraliomargarita sinensis]